MSLDRPPRVRASRLQRALALPLAVWTLLALILGGTHVADGDHARRDDGTLVHIGPRIEGESHTGCEHHSPDSTVDRDGRPAEAAEVCWLSRFASRDGAAPLVIARPLRAPLPGTIPHASPRSPTALAVLRHAPKTSPPA